MFTLVWSRVRTAALALSAVAALASGTTGAAAAPVPAPAKQGPTSVAYIEVNNHSMLNAGEVHARQRRRQRL